ncbi:MAG: hypothetical protein WCG21_11915 [Eubacteriales bacterium]
MEKYLWDFRYVIVVLLALLVYTIFNWQKVKAMAYKGMLQAKTLAKDAVLKSGKEQEDWVVETIWPLLPAAVRLFISKTVFREIIQKLYRTAKDYLDDGQLNGSIPSTPTTPEGKPNG